MQSAIQQLGNCAMWSAAYYEARVLAAVLRSPVPITYAETGEMKASARAEYSIVSAQEQVVRSGAVGAVRHSALFPGFLTLVHLRPARLHPSRAKSAGLSEIGIQGALRALFGDAATQEEEITP